MFEAACGEIFFKALSQELHDQHFMQMRSSRREWGVRMQAADNASHCQSNPRRENPQTGRQKGKGRVCLGEEGDSKEEEKGKGEMRGVAYVQHWCARMFTPDTFCQLEQQLCSSRVWEVGGNVTVKKMRAGNFSAITSTEYRDRIRSSDWRLSAKIVFLFLSLKDVGS
ncbi:hypothetical protein EYF80_014649 [Liparis tanakae]|uniref:Uncharacterized protein n=1 Tax=Liparis tanakae TaxID=230148 RepID=A0A4Z2IAL6_9TELE|nr:hypothetical protein EYF80_014649 [Liparis tanakae]